MTDGERYRWIVENNAEIQTDGCTWTSAEGEKYVSPFILVVKQTMISGHRSLNSAIDYAVENVT